MSGGFNDYKSEKRVPERLDLLVETLKKIDADFVSLVDTHRWTEVFTEDDLKKIFGYKNVFSVKLEDERLKIKGHDNGVTVLTKLPVEKFEAVRLFNRNAIKTTINGIDIFTTYLDDMNEDTRIKQTKSLLELVKPNVPTIIAGDLNTFDQDDVKKSTLKLQDFFDKNPKLEEMKTVINSMARAEVVEMFKSRGFIDMGKKSGNTVPSKLFPIKFNEPIMRLDYGFCTPDIKIESFEVLRDEVFDRLSDHFPIKMRVDFK